MKIPRSISSIEPLEARIAPAAAVFEVSTLDGTNGFVLGGVAAGDTYGGISVSDAGDVNGDGFGDVIVGAASASRYGEYSYASGVNYVVFGKAGGFSANLNLSTLDGSNGFRLSSPLSRYDNSASSVSAAGDVNGDGFGDIIVGGYSADTNGAFTTGASYVVFGKASAFAADLDLSTLNGSNGFKLSGVAVNDESGRSVSTAGDVNGDGFDDLIIGAAEADPNGSASGATYVIFGKAGGFAANVNLSNLNGSNGFRMSGGASDDLSGLAVSDAGDVNGDGFGDVIIGAPGADPNGSSSGAAYVVFGNASGFTGDLNLSTLNGSNGFKLSGGTLLNRTGISVSGAGDVNGDGSDDLIIGGDLSYVVFGKAIGFAPNMNLSTLNGSDGFSLTQNASSNPSVSGAGDFNGDGFDDLLIGVYGAGYTGASYLVFGKAAGFTANLDLAQEDGTNGLDGSNGFTLLGVADGDQFGRAVSAAGDLNNDGFNDLIVGARGAPEGAEFGASYVLFGSALGPFASVSISDTRVVEGLNSTAMASVTVTLSSLSAQTVTVQYATADGTASAPSDYTAAGLTTLTFAPGERTQTVLIPIRTDGPTEADETFFVRLSSPTNATIADGEGQILILNNNPANPRSFELAALDGSNGFKLSGVSAYDYSGGSVRDAGDVNGDGFGDLIIGASLGDPNGTDSGASYVVFGKAGGFAANLNLSALDGSNGFSLSGVAAGDGSGSSVSAAGDVNGDGFGDLIIGAGGADPNGLSSGASYVVFGKAGGFAANLNLSALDGSNGFKLSGVSAYDGSGRSVSAAGDVNGDGFGDLIIGAGDADPNGLSSGASYVVFGKAGGFAANLNLSTLDGSNGFKLSGVAAFDQSGLSVSAAADVNGDGFGDLIIGAGGADADGALSGASYVVFGKAGGFAVDLNLSTLDGSNGFKLSGSGHDYSGGSVSAAGDVNGDGFGDLIIGARGADPNGYDSGASYVVFGKASGFAANLNLSTVDGSNGFKLSGVAAYDYSGLSVSAAGDVNGDGFSDLVIGASGYDLTGDRAGAAYVVFGKAVGFAPELSLAALDGRSGFQLNGVASGDNSGIAVTAAGDVNGDGFGDLLIGASGAGPNGDYSGASYVVFGRAAGTTPVLSINDVTVAEGNSGTTPATFIVSLSAASTLTVSVDYSTQDGAANAGGDYTTLANQTLTFAPGETSKTISIDVLGDMMVEPDEAFFINLTGSTNATLADAQGQGTILNDDAAPGLPSVSIGDVSVTEGNSGTNAATFTVRLSTASVQTVSVSYSTQDGTAIAGGDFTALANQTVTFTPGETAKTITVDVLGDLMAEPDETFLINLSAPTNATLGDAQGQGTILNDDAAPGLPSVSIGNASIVEGNSGTAAATFTVSLSAPSTQMITLDYATADGTATAGEDFTALALSTLIFLPGETEKTITVDVVGDAVIELDETFFVNLSSVTNATLAATQGTGIILGDDSDVVVTPVNGTAVMFEDADGDQVVVKVSKGTLTGARFVFDANGNLDLIDLTGAQGARGASASPFANAKLIVSAESKNGGNGLVNVGAINASGLSLKSVKVEGDLGKIDAGEGIEGKSAFKKLTANSIGLSSVPGAESMIAGTVGVLNIKNSVRGVLNVTGGLADEASASGSGVQTIKKVVIGGNIDGSAGGDRAGLLRVSGDIGSVVVKGSVIGGAELSGIVVGGKAGKIVIGGDLMSDDADHPVTVSALGSVTATTQNQALALKQVDVAGNVLNAEILAGFRRDGTPMNADAGIGKIIVDGSWTASSAAAGVEDVTGDGYGINDLLIGGGNGGILSRIASITIAGALSGSGQEGDHFGITAQQVGEFKLGRARQPLVAGNGDTLLLAADFTLVDFA